MNRSNASGLTAAQQAVIKKINKEVFAKLPDENFEPLLTELAVAFSSGNVDPDQLAKIELALANAGTMAANNIQGLEARRARAENETPARYLPFTWKPTQGDADSRLSGILAGLQDLSLAVNEAPPAPPAD